MTMENRDGLRCPTIFVGLIGWKLLQYDGFKFLQRTMPEYYILKYRINSPKIQTYILCLNDLNISSQNILQLDKLFRKTQQQVQKQCLLHKLDPRFSTQ